MVVHTLLWPDEIRDPDFPSLDADVEVRAPELKMAGQVVESMSDDFRPEQYSDTYQEQLQELVDAKLAGGQAFTPEEKSTSLDETEDVSDLLAKLEASVRRRREQSAASQTKVACTGNDCIARMAEYGLNTVEFDDKAKTCNALFDCNTILPDTLKECPFQNTASCCTDPSGAFTGQVCPEGQNCLNGVCAPTGYYCHTDGQCVEVKNPSSLDGFYGTKDDCSRVCVPQTIIQENVMAYGGKRGASCTSGDTGACTALGQSRASGGNVELDTSRDWTCEYTSMAQRVAGKNFGECPVNCKCTGVNNNKSLVYH